MKRRGNMLLIMLLMSGAFFCLLMAANQSTPKLYLGEGESLRLEEDVCYNLAGEWKRVEREDGSIHYVLRFHLPEPSNLCVYIAMTGSPLLINGQLLERADKNFIVWPLSYSPAEDGNYTLDFSPGISFRKNIAPYVVYIGSLPQVTALSYRNYGLSFAVLGITLLGLSYSFGLYLYKRTEKYLLILALFCLWCFLSALDRVGTDLYGIPSLYFNRLPRFTASELRYEYANLIYRKVTIAIVCSYLFGIFIPIQVRGRNYAWYLLLAALLPIPLINGDNFRPIAYAYLPALISLSEACIILHSPPGMDRVTERVFLVGSGLATGYRLFMAASDLELCAHGNLDVFYKNYTVIHVIYIIMFVIAISRKYAQRFGEAERLRGELELAREGLEETVRLRTKDLQASYAALKQQKEQSERFLSAVLHNIKTPLFSLMGHCDMLSVEEDPGAKRADLNIIHNNIHYVKDMLDNLSTAFHMERDRELLRMQPFDFTRMMRDVEDVTIGRTRFAETEVDFDIPQGEEPLAIRGDPFYLGQALQNIIDNGLRHCGGRGRVRVSAHAAGDSLYITIADTGDGIAPEDLPHIFDRHYSKHAGARSMGLGLTIAREVIRRHGGDIRADSRLGEGSTFTVTLPLEQGKEGK